ncbi:SdpI family protein [Anaerofustis sp. HA2171]|uniref:SdpI family protein n=1 Tax=Anaerofustis butyriciformans TaxID=3108533 RepID=UPI002E33195A|nr:SdpI family protein [Anaerofustis sp. HA2171]
MKIKINKEIILSTICCFIPTILCLFVYDKLPGSLPIHFDASGNPDGYVSKEIFIFVMPFIYAALNLLVNVFINNDPKRKNASKVIFTLSKWIIPILTILFCFISILSALYENINTSTFVLALMGLVFIIIGNYLPKCKQNYTMGVKLPWTLNSKVNWNKTHRLSGFIWVIAGIIQIASAFFRLPQAIFLTSVAVMVIVPIAYSFILYKKGI